MNKLILCASLTVILAAASADAGVIIEPIFGVPAAPVYAAPPPPPPPVYYDPYYHPYHHNGDWRYWHEREAHERWEREHARWDGDHYHR